MKLSEFDYPLPEELIAQGPLPERDASRMLLLGRTSGVLKHSTFRELPSFLRAGDLLVLNESRVVKARLEGKRRSGGAVECFVLREAGAGNFECLLRSSARKEDLEFQIPDLADAKVLGSGTVPGTFFVHFHFHGVANMDELLARAGHVPLPPYITRADDARDSERYQTVYAREAGSVAAPTAGLHFTPEMLATLQKAGIGIAFVLLHVGLGTFQPIKSETVEEHRMHKEWYSIPKATLEALLATKREGGRVIAVGSTSLRSLESWARDIGKQDEHGWSGWTDLFLAPGAEFRAVDGMLTNFHLPKSTLFVLVAAFAGLERAKEAYARAVAERYRFFSYGDCMLIL